MFYPAPISCELDLGATSHRSNKSVLGFDDIFQGDVFAISVNNP